MSTNAKRAKAIRKAAHHIIAEQIAKQQAPGYKGDIIKDPYAIPPDTFSERRRIPAPANGFQTHITIVNPANTSPYRKLVKKLKRHAHAK